MPNSKAVGATLFPGAHCLHIELPNILKIRKAIFLRDAQVSEEDFQRWTRSELSPRPFSISIPPIAGRSSLPQEALLTFASRASDDNVLCASCAIVLFRKPDAVDHIEQDMIPLLRRIRALSTEPPDMDAIIRRILTHIGEFYTTVDAGRMAPVLKQRVYALSTDAYLGHVCAGCGLVGATLRYTLGKFYVRLWADVGHIGVPAAPASTTAAASASAPTGRSTSRSALRGHAHAINEPRVG